MAMHKEQLPQRVRVQIIECERGWGQKVEDNLYFDTKEEADEYVRTYNAECNPPGPAPDWYMIARRQ